MLKNIFFYVLKIINIKNNKVRWKSFKLLNYDKFIYVLLFTDKRSFYGSIKYKAEMVRTVEGKEKTVEFVLISYTVGGFSYKISLFIMFLDKT